MRAGRTVVAGVGLGEEGVGSDDGDGLRVGALGARQRQRRLEEGVEEAVKEGCAGGHGSGRARQRSPCHS